MRQNLPTRRLRSHDDSVGKPEAFNPHFTASNEPVSDSDDSWDGDAVGFGFGEQPNGEFSQGEKSLESFDRVPFSELAERCYVAQTCSEEAIRRTLRYRANRPRTDLSGNWVNHANDKVSRLCFAMATHGSMTTVEAVKQMDSARLCRSYGTRAAQRRSSSFEGGGTGAAGRSGPVVTEKFRGPPIWSMRIPREVAVGLGSKNLGACGACGAGVSESGGVCSATSENSSAASSGVTGGASGGASGGDAGSRVAPRDAGVSGSSFSPTSGAFPNAARATGENDGHLSDSERSRGPCHGQSETAGIGTAGGGSSWGTRDVSRTNGATCSQQQPPQQPPQQPQQRRQRRMVLAMPQPGLARHQITMDPADGTFVRQDISFLMHSFTWQFSPGQGWTTCMSAGTPGEVDCVWSDDGLELHQRHVFLVGNLY